MDDLNHDGRIDWHDRYQQALNTGQVIADKVTWGSGTWTFVFAHLLWWGYWLGFQHFDPFPFGLLTMVLSLEAILLSTLVLMSQNRSAVRDRVAQEQRDHMQERIETLIQKNNDLTGEIHEWTRPRTRTRKKAP